MDCLHVKMWEVNHRLLYKIFDGVDNWLAIRSYRRLLCSLAGGSVHVERLPKSAIQTWIRNN